MYRLALCACACACVDVCIGGGIADVSGSTRPWSLDEALRGCRSAEPGTLSKRLVSCGFTLTHTYIEPAGAMCMQRPCSLGPMRVQNDCATAACNTGKAMLFCVTDPHWPLAASTSYWYHQNCIAPTKTATPMMNDGTMRLPHSRRCILLRAYRTRKNHKKNTHLQRDVIHPRIVSIENERQRGLNLC